MVDVITEREKDLVEDPEKPAFKPAFSNVDLPYLQRLQAIESADKDKVSNFEISEVLRGLTVCTGAEVHQALAKVNKKRNKWKTHPFVCHPFDTPNNAETRHLNKEELKHCLMVFTYTDSVLFESVSRLLNNPDKRKAKALASQIEGAQLWISCIRWSLSHLAVSFPGWVHHGKKWRGMQFQYPELNTQFKVDAEIAWYTIKSTTSCADVLQRDTFAGQTGKRTIFEILDCPALTLSQISEYPDEFECLLLPGSFFRIHERIQRKQMLDGDPFHTADKVTLKFLGNNIQQCLDALKYKNENHVVVIRNPGSGKSTLHHLVEHLLDVMFLNSSRHLPTAATAADDLPKDAAKAADDLPKEAATAADEKVGSTQEHKELEESDKEAATSADEKVGSTQGHKLLRESDKKTKEALTTADGATSLTMESDGDTALTMESGGYRVPDLDGRSRHFYRMVSKITERLQRASMLQATAANAVLAALDMSANRDFPSTCVSDASWETSPNVPLSKHQESRHPFVQELG